MLLRLKKLYLIHPCQDYEYPTEWTGAKNNIWIKIKNLQKEESLSANNFIVSSTGGSLTLHFF